jgi:queuosine precursor transporter
MKKYSIISIMNHTIFIFYITAVSIASILALRLGGEALVALMCLEWVLANLFVVKQISLFGLDVTASDALAIGSTLSLNLLQEYYGKTLAQKAIFISFFASSFYVIMTLLHLAYVPHSFDTSHIHFAAILSPMPRLIIASLIAYLITQTLECKLYAFFRMKFHNRHFILRNYLSVALTQLLDTILFTFIGLYGIIEHAGHVIIVSYAIKLITLIINIPFLAYVKNRLPNKFIT